MWELSDKESPISADTLKGNTARLASETLAANTIVIPSNSGPAFLGDFIDKSFKSLQDIPAISTPNVGSYIRTNSSGLSIELSPAVVSSMDTSGYMRLHNGLMLQWGFVAKTTESNHDATLFPTVFPTACLNITLTPQISAATTSSHWNVRVLSFSKESVTIEVCISSSTNIYGVNYFAIGY